MSRAPTWTILDDLDRDPASQAASQRSLQRDPLLLEASRVARELHDELAQTLFAIASAAKELGEREALDADVRRDADAILQLALTGSRELREAFHSFRGSGPVTQRGLAAAVSALRDEAPGLAVEVAVDPELREARDAVAELLYRTCREGLANASRHASATRCRLRCGLSGTDATATVEDDGKGVDPDASRRGFGLRFLAEALEGAGGSLELASSRSGTLLEARVPLRR